MQISELTIPVELGLQQPACTGDTDLYSVGGVKLYLYIGNLPTYTYILNLNLVWLFNATLVFFRHLFLVIVALHKLIALIIDTHHTSHIFFLYMWFYSYTILYLGTYFLEVIIM